MMVRNMELFAQRMPADKKKILRIVPVEKGMQVTLRDGTTWLHKYDGSQPEQIN